MKLSARMFCIIIYCLILFSPGHSSGGELPPETPLINPLGDLRLYSQVEYREAYPIFLKIPSEKNGYSESRVYGDNWKMEAPYKGSREEAYHDLAAYLTSLGAEIFFRDENNLLLARLNEKEGKTWWVDLAFYNKEYRLSVNLVRNWNLKQPLTIEFPENGRKTICFYRDANGEHFETLLVDAEPGLVWLAIAAEEDIDGYKRKIEYKRYFKQEKSQRYRLSDIPQGAGQYLWEVRSDHKGTVTLQVEKGGTLPAIARSGELGSVLVKNIASTGVLAEPDDSAWIEHPELSAIPVHGDLTPDGGSLLMLPPGFWKLSLSPPNSAVSAVEAGMIPVKPGEQTVVAWPTYMTRAFGIADSAGGVEITTTEIGATEGTIRFNLVGDEARKVDLLQAKIDVMEGVENGRVLGFEEASVPPDIVLLLDSSGSMKGQMQTALDATREFINGLPQECRIRIIDFDTAPKLLPGETKEAVLASLARVKADGATALYDTVLAGLELLKESRRPSLVLFTDGVDANWNDTAPGSKATQKELLDAVRQAKVGIFTIGFGKGHDQDTLNRLASISGGLYFSADDAQALEKTFATILESVVNSYQLRYARPAQARPSDVPVIQLVLDTSGSMGESIPTNEGVSRLDSLKEILRDFLLALPAETLISVQSFSDTSMIRQVATSDKDILLRSIGMLQPQNGTEILIAAQAAVRSLRAIPSTQRYLVFVTDAAISLSAEEQEKFNTLLGKIRDERIRALWIGTGLGSNSADAVKAFQQAAEMSGGRYAVEDDPVQIAARFTDLTAAIQQETGSRTKTNLRLTISQRDANGKVRAFAASTMVELPGQIPGGEIVAPKLLSYEFGPMPPRYDATSSALVTGESEPRQATIIAKRIPLDVQTANRACTFKVSEALYLSRLHAVDAPAKQRFLALTMEFSNTLPEEEVVVYPDGSDHPAAWLDGGAGATGRIEKKIPAYLIPDLQRHLYLQLNNSLMIPVSTTTWLTEAPLILPGERSLLVLPAAPVQGTAVFLIPDVPVDQASLHFYDIRYGHADLALVGEFTKTLDLEELPPGPPVKLSDSFALALRGYEDREKIEDVQAPAGTLFRIIDLNLESKVQALLDIDPGARFSLRLPTAEGSVQFPLHGITSLLPLGFWQPTFFAPGSENLIRLAFQVPADLAGKAAGALVVDVKGGGLVLPLSGKPPATPVLDLAKAAKGDGIDVIINATGSVAEVNGEKGDWRVVDLTLIDRQDGKATRLGNIFALHRDDAEGREWRFATPDEMENRKKGLAKFSSGNKPVITLQVKTDPAGHTLLTGLTSQSVVPDGIERRGVMVFRMPQQDDSGRSWQLRSDWFPNLAVGISGEPYADKDMLRILFASESKPSGDEKKLQEALVNVVREYRARAGEKPGRHAPAKITLDSDLPPGRDLAVPAIVSAGAERFRTISTLAELKKALAEFPWLPGADKPWTNTLSPEALFTQGWGTDDDIARAVEVILARMGYTTERKIVKLSEEARKALARQLEPAQLKRRELPAVSYVDNQGQAHVLVSPFLQDLSEIENLVTLDSEARPRSENSVEIKVEAEVAPVSSERAQMTGKMASALAGADGKQKTRMITLLKADLDREQLSRDPSDLVYVEGLDTEGEYYTAVLESPGGQTPGEGKLYKRDEIVVALKIEIRFMKPFMIFEHIRPLAEGEELTGLFQTIGLNLPDLPRESAVILENALKEAGRPGDPDDLSALRWYTHTTMARFLVGQTQIERDLASRLKIKTGRTAKPRVILMNVSRRSTQEPVTATIDLLQAGTEVHSGTDEAQRAFRIISGLATAKLEESVLGSSGYGVFSMWDNAPEGTNLFWITNTNRVNVARMLTELDFPETVVEHIRKSKNFLMFPTSQTVVNGLPRWGWLEIDPETYEIVSVLDNGLHGGIVEYDLQTWYSEAQLHMFGFMLGVSSSVWAVSSFSLTTDDFQEIIKNAEALVRGIAKNLETFLANSGAPNLGTAEMIERGGAPSQDSGGGGLPVSFGGGPSVEDFLADRNKELLEHLEENKISVGQSFLGFAQGFDMGVSYYFGN